MSSSEDEGILKKALDVELPKDFDPSKAPTTGEEYLHHVIYERKQCRKLITVDIDRSKLGNTAMKIEQNEPIKKAPAHILPTEEWQKHQVADFIKLRKFVAWNTKNEPTNQLIHESQWQHRLLHEKPTFSQLTSLKQNAKIALLAKITEYLKNGGAQDGAVSANVGIWIYSTLATLEMPLQPSDCFELRELAKALATVRARLTDGATAAEYKHLNLCICLIARVFGQIDLVDK